MARCTAARSIQKFHAEYGEYLDAVENMIQEVLQTEALTTQSLTNYLLNSKGKRLRPALVLLSAFIYNPEPARIIDVAAAAELIHMASLVHDDVIDGADMRRGRKTLSSVWGNRLAVLEGDYLFAKAYGLLSKHQRYGVIDYMTRAIVAMCEGEIEQAARAFDENQSEESYLSNISKKTSHLLAACCKSGASLGHAPEDEALRLWEFGMNLGCAFQIIDDVLDFMSDSSTLGKPVGSDLGQGVLTLPVIYTLKNRDASAVLKEIITRRQFDAATMEKVKSLLISNGAIEYCYRMAVGLVDRAKTLISSLPEMPSRRALEELADFVVVRKW